MPPEDVQLMSMWMTMFSAEIGERENKIVESM